MIYLSVLCIVLLAYIAYLPYAWSKTRRSLKEMIVENDRHNPPPATKPATATSISKPTLTSTLLTSMTPRSEKPALRRKSSSASRCPAL